MSAATSARSSNRAQRIGVVFVVLRIWVRLGTTYRDFQFGYAVTGSARIRLRATLVNIFIVPRHLDVIRIMLNFKDPFSASSVFNQYRFS